MNPQLVLRQEDHRRIVAVAQRLVRDAHAKAVFLVEKDGQLVADVGEFDGIDTTSLASLVAGNIAASGALAKIIGEDEFPVHFHQGKRDNVHITIVAERIIMAVIFDDRSSLGLVRLRVKKAGVQLAQVFEEIFKKAELEDNVQDSPFTDITDEDIENLFSD